MFGYSRRALKRYFWFRKNFDMSKRSGLPLLWALYRAERVL